MVRRGLEHLSKTCLCGGVVSAGQRGGGPTKNFGLGLSGSSQTGYGQEPRQDTHRLILTLFPAKYQIE